MTKFLLLLVALFVIVVVEVNLTGYLDYHGSSFQKKALGKSKVVDDMNVNAITNRITWLQRGNIRICNERVNEG